MMKMSSVWICVPVICFGVSTISEPDVAHSLDVGVRSLPHGSVERPQFLLPPEDLVSPRTLLPAEALVSPLKPDVSTPVSQDVDPYLPDLDLQFR